MRTRLKVCCIASREEVALAVTLGADALGLVSAMPSGPGVLEESLIAELAGYVPPPVASVLLTNQSGIAAIIAQARYCRVNTLQLVDHLPVEIYPQLREALPAVRLVQAVHVEDEGAIPEAMRYAAYADALLLDSGRRNGEVKELGGTGRVHDWAVSRAIVAAAPVPVFLAGGITPDNVQDAMMQVRPFGIDVCTGLRREGRLDAEKLASLTAAIRMTDRYLA